MKTNFLDWRSQWKRADRRRVKIVEGGPAFNWKNSPYKPRYWTHCFSFFLRNWDPGIIVTRLNPAAPVRMLSPTWTRKITRRCGLQLTRTTDFTDPGGMEGLVDPATGPGKIPLCSEPNRRPRGQVSTPRAIRLLRIAEMYYMRIYFNWYYSYIRL